MSDAPIQKPIRHGIIVVIFKRTKHGILIMTQTRHVRDKSYDSLYDNTQEAVGELEKPEESLETTILRAFQEELGQPPDFRPIKIWGASSRSWTTGREDLVQCHRPFCFVESLGEPQFWKDPCFAVEVAENWQPDYDKGDGEAIECQWWHLEDLLEAAEKGSGVNGGCFWTIMGFHRPIFSTFCHLALIGEFD